MQTKRLWRPGDSGQEEPIQQPPNDANEVDDELDALLDSYERQAQKDAKKVMPKKPAGQVKGMVAARKEGLETAIGADNKGFQLLKKLGYKEGTALGISKTGLVEPIALNLKSNRSGLGVDEAKRRREEQAQEQRRQEELKRQRMQEQGKELYVQDQRQGFAQRKALKALRSAWSSIEQLDERSGKPSDALWAKLVALHPPPEEGAPAGAAAAVRAAEDEVHEQHAPAGASAGTDEVAGDTGGQAGQLTLAEQVDVALKYLRSEYNYCVFCGCQYADEADMLGNCPGMNEDDH